MILGFPNSSSRFFVFVWAAFELTQQVTCLSIFVSRGVTVLLLSFIWCALKIYWQKAARLYQRFSAYTDIQTRLVRMRNSEVEKDQTGSVVNVTGSVVKDTVKRKKNRHEINGSRAKGAI